MTPSATSDDLKFSQANPTKEAKQLESMFDLLASANSRRFEDQRMSSPPPRAVSVYEEDKLDKQQDLDDFLDMLSSVSTSRIDEQRSPPPSKTVSPKKSKKMKTIPRYTLPTEPPLREEYLQFPNKPTFPCQESSPVPVYSSTTDIPSEVEAHSSPVVMTQPVQRKSMVASLSSYDSVFSDEPSSSCYSVSVTDEVYPQQDSPQSEPGFKHSFRHQANTYDASVISEPLKRRNTPFKRNTVHPHSPTNSALLNNIRSPTSPLTMTTYSGPRGSPLNIQQTTATGLQVTNPSNRPIQLHVEKLRITKLKASSVANIADADDLGDFDLFRAASDGDLLQSSTNDDSVFEFSPTSAHKSTDIYTDTNQNYLKQNQRKKSSSTSENSPSGIDSIKHCSPPTFSDSYSAANKQKRHRSSTGGFQNGSQYTSDRRFSDQSAQKNAAPSPTNNLRRSSENSGQGSIGANLLYSASLGFDSIPRLNSSRDRLSSMLAELTENLTTEM